MTKKQITPANKGYTSGGFQSNLQALGSLARAVTVDNESATEPARCIPSTLGASVKTETTMLRINEINLWKTTIQN